MACPNPLKPEDCDTLNRVLQAIHDTQELIVKCESCGIPLAEQAAINASMNETASKIKATFFPNNP